MYCIWKTDLVVIAFACHLPLADRVAAPTVPQRFSRFVGAVSGRTPHGGSCSSRTVGSSKEFDGPNRTMQPARKHVCYAY
jgi:hypothetical protein